MIPENNENALLAELEEKRSTRASSDHSLAAFSIKNRFQCSHTWSTWQLAATPKHAHIDKRTRASRW